MALTAAARGNPALALLLTVATNLLGIVTVPYELKLILLGTSVVSVDPSSLVVKLIFTVLVPTLIGKAACSLSSSVQVRFCLNPGPCYSRALCGWRKAAP